jgi:hypothetical protein
MTSKRLSTAIWTAQFKAKVKCPHGTIGCKITLDVIFSIANICVNCSRYWASSTGFSFPICLKHHIVNRELCYESRCVVNDRDQYAQDTGGLTQMRTAAANFMLFIRNSLTVAILAIWEEEPLWILVTANILGVIRSVWSPVALILAIKQFQPLSI